MTVVLPTGELNPGKAEWSEVYGNDKALKDGIETLQTEFKSANKPLTWYTPKVIATEQSTSSTSFTTLTTADEIKEIVIPENGLLVVGYQALWKRSTGLANPQAAFFLDSNQLKVPQVNDASATQAAVLGGLEAGKWSHLRSAPCGLLSPRPVSDASTVSTGEAMGYVAASNASQTMILGGSEILVGPEATALRNLFGGMCVIGVAAGTYAISVRFKTSSGTVTAKERKLWAYVIGS